MSIFRKIFSRHKEQTLTGEQKKLMALPDRIITLEEANAVFKQANALSDKEDFHLAIELYNRLLIEPPPAVISVINPLEIKKSRAITYCKAGRFTEAEQDLKELLNILKSYGLDTSNSQEMYWLLVVRHKGDEDKALKEFIGRS